MFNKFIKYYHSNPEGYWFKRKVYGWGWVPVRWQGWLTTLVYVSLIMTLVSMREQVVIGNPDSGSNFITLALPIILLTVSFFFVAYKKGEKPRWSWGWPKDKE